MLEVANIPSALTSIVAAAAAAAAATSLGMNTWRRQLRGTADHDLAHRILRAVYEVRRRVIALRQPYLRFAASGPVAQMEGAAEYQDASQQTETQYDLLLEELTKARSTLDLELLEAEILWGDKMLAALQTLDGGIGKLRAEIFRHVRA